MSFTSSGRSKILVVEDDLYMQTILNEYLNGIFEAVICNNGVDALSFLQDGNIPDLVISDLNVPKLNGLELIAQIKASDFFKNILCEGIRQHTISIPLTNEEPILMPFLKESPVDLIDVYKTWHRCDRERIGAAPPRARPACAAAKAPAPVRNRETPTVIRHDNFFMALKYTFL